MSIDITKPFSPAEIKDLLNDKFLIEESNEMTRELLERGAPINMICKLVKGYQRVYIEIKNSSVALARHFTYMHWLEHQSKQEVCENTI